MPHVPARLPPVPHRAGAAARPRRAWLGAAAGVALAVAAPAGADARGGSAETLPSAEVQLVEGDILVAPRLAFRGVGLDRAERLWPNGEVPFRFDAALGPGAVRAVRAAVARWNAVSGVTLRPVAADGETPTDLLVFQPATGCASWVGRQGGAQAVWVGPSCSSGSVMHEIGHALGLEHEHTRADRDAHVRVLWDNVDAEKRHNFALAPPDARLLGDYDIDSIMHYGPANFSAEGRPTLEPLDPAATGRMGQRKGPSAGDIAAVARLYASDLALDVSVDDERAAREVTLFVTNEHPQGAHELRLTLAGDGLDVVAQSVGEWSCEAARARVECHLERLAGEASSHVTLAFGTPLPGAALHAELSSKTPDLDPSDNGGQPDAAPPALAAAAFDSASDAANDAAPETRRVGGGGAGLPLLLGLLLWGAGRRRVG